MKRRLGVITLIILAAAAQPGTVAGAGSGRITADLDGRSISIRSIARQHCHDFDHPRIHCFSSRRAAETDAGRWLGAAGAAPLIQNYVRIFADAGWAGASMYLSLNYSNLGTIGWNDRISSFKGLNSLSGTFWTEAAYAGYSYSFCCNAQVTYVGDFYNDRFSSVRRP